METCRSVCIYWVSISRRVNYIMTVWSQLDIFFIRTRLNKWIFEYLHNIYCTVTKYKYTHPAVILALIRRHLKPVCWYPNLLAVFKMLQWFQMFGTSRCCSYILRKFYYCDFFPIKLFANSRVRIYKWKSGNKQRGKKNGETNRSGCWFRVYSRKTERLINTSGVQYFLI